MNLNRLFYWWLRETQGWQIQKSKKSKDVLQKRKTFTSKTDQKFIITTFFHSNCNNLHYALQVCKIENVLYRTF